MWLGAVAVALVVLFAAWSWTRRPSARPGRKAHALDALDTVADWPPTVTRVLTTHERHAYATLAKALPDHIVLAQVPVSRFVKVPTRHSYAEWLGRVGQLAADLIVCDRGSQVIAVVEIRSPRESARSRKRHERLARVLRAAGVRVLEWNEGDLPTPTSVREALVPREAESALERSTPAMARSFSQRPLTSIPTGEVEETGPGELHELREPPPSTWFDDFDAQPDARPPGPPRR